MQDTYYSYLENKEKKKKLSEDKLFEIIGNIDIQIATAKNSLE